MLSRLQAMEHISEAIRNPIDTHTASRRAESNCTSQAVRGIMMISATRDEVVIWMSSTAMKAPSITLITAIQSRRVGSPTGRSSWSPAIRLVFDVHFDGDGHAGADFALQRVIRGKREFHRNPLYDFGEVAGGIVRR